MSRRGGIALAATLLGVLVLPSVPAAAGGGCHAGVTQGSGVTVEIVDACFTPTTLRVDPGDAVTFVNTDPFVHNVGGNLWGHFDDLNAGDAFTATFGSPGIYPYACNYHPGMTGAIVVGDGVGVGNGETVTVDAFEQPSPVVRVKTVTEGASGAPVAIGWIAGAAIGIALGLGLGFLVRRSARSAA